MGNALIRKLLMAVGHIMKEVNIFMCLLYLMISVTREPFQQTAESTCSSVNVIFGTGCFTYVYIISISLCFKWTSLIALNRTKLIFVEISNIYDAIFSLLLSIIYEDKIDYLEVIYFPIEVMFFMYRSLLDLLDCKWNFLLLGKNLILHNANYHSILITNL